MASSAPKTWPPTLLELLTASWGFGLPASPLQRAIALAADGRSIEDELDGKACDAHFGCTPEELGRVLPALVVIVAGVRSAKSMIAAAAGFLATQTADLSQLRRHEIPRVAIVAPTVDNATATFRHLVGLLQGSEILSRAIVGEPTADTVFVEREDGRTVEIVVVAAHRAGVTLRSRWLCAFICDEIASFGSDALGAVVNAEELLRAAEGRIVPGGQAWLISSPFGPQGLLYDLFKSHFGKPGRELVVHAPTLAMWPGFGAEKVAAVRARDPDAAAREFDAAWIDADSAFLNGTTIDKSVRSGPLELAPGGICHAAWDVGTRGNAWTLVVARGERNEGVTKVKIVLAREWIGSKKVPLDPEKVIAEVAEILGRYDVNRIDGDAYSIDALRALARVHGLHLREVRTGPDERYERFLTVNNELATGCLELPPVPALLNDLKAVRKRATVNAVRIELPRTADGRHCDFAPPVTLAVAAALRSPNGATLRRPRAGAGYEMLNMLQAEGGRTATGATNRYAFRRGGY